MLGGGVGGLCFILSGQSQIRGGRSDYKKIIFSCRQGFKLIIHDAGAP